MRSAVGFFGLSCGVVVVALVSSYGYKTTDIEFDAWVMAFLYGVIAVFGLAGHTVAVRLWRFNRLTAVVAGLVAAVALILNLSNSLGAIAGRSEVATTEAIDKNRRIRAAETELKRLEDLRSALPAFVPTDRATVSAAERAANAATKSREAECAKRGSNCRAREADERDANSKLATATASKAATDRASKLEADADAQRRLLDELGPLTTVNVQGSALARLFRVPDEEAGFATTVQQLGMSIVADLSILMCLICWEVMGPARESRPTPAAPVTAPRTRPTLVVTSPASPVGSVNRILTDNLKAALGDQVEFAQLAERYREICKRDGKRAVSQNEFVAAVEQFCKGVGIRRHNRRGLVYLADVALVHMSIDTQAYIAYKKGSRDGAPSHTAPDTVKGCQNKT